MHWPAVLALADTARGRSRMLAGAARSPRYIPPAVNPAQDTSITASIDPVR